MHALVPAALLAHPTRRRRAEGSSTLVAAARVAAKRGGALFSLALLACAAIACSDPPVRPPPAGDATESPGMGGAGGGGAAASDGGADAGGGDGGAEACTDLPKTGAVIDQNAYALDLPPGIGGDVEDGTYELTDAAVYVGAAGLPGPTGAAYQGTLRVTGQRFERVLVLSSAGGASAETASSGALTLAGINATLALTCPSASQEQVTYSATPTSLVLSNLVTKESFTFTRN